MSRKLAVNTTVEGDTYPAGSTPPEDVAKKVTNPKAWGETVTADDESEGYDGLKVAALKSEIESRNEGRADEDQLPTSGNKAELIAVLEADDAAGA